MALSPPHTRPVPVAAWKSLEEKHRASIESITVPMRNRKSRGKKHPVFDFLHTYYSFSLGRLEKWHPGVGRVLVDDPATDFSAKYYRRENGVVFADPSKLTEKGRSRLIWIHNLLKLIHDRPPHLACHGLHEWAMVYSGADIRHRESAPVRLPQEEIDALVSSRPVSCSHFDAFRFFAPGATRFNRLCPTLLTREDHEQPGCIHANMDLYKWAYKSSPWISSDLLARTLFFAIEAREIDMRASPYDLTSYGYEPIPVETPAGRREYEREQLALYQKGLPIRAELIRCLEEILQI